MHESCGRGGRRGQRFEPKAQKRQAVSVRDTLRGGAGIIEAARLEARRLSSHGAQPGAASGDSPDPNLARPWWKALIDIAAPRRA